MYSPNPFQNTPFFPGSITTNFEQITSPFLAQETDNTHILNNEVKGSLSDFRAFISKSVNLLIPTPKWAKLSFWDLFHFP